MRDDRVVDSPAVLKRIEQGHAHIISLDELTDACP